MSRAPGRTSRKRESILSSQYIEGAVRSGQEALRAAGVNPDPPLLEAMAAYIELLLRWNRKINLTTITEPAEIVSRNFVESFFAVRWLGAETGRLCDVGSGAGFPGLALKLVRPQWQATLLEPIRKKAAFLAEVGRVLKLKDLQIECVRWQESKLQPGSLDAVTARALGDYEEFVHWSRAKLRQGGKILLWAGEREAEALRGIPGWSWELALLPGSRARVLLVGSRL